MRRPPFAPLLLALAMAAGPAHAAKPAVPKPPESVPPPVVTPAELADLGARIPRGDEAALRRALELAEGVTPGPELEALMQLVGAAVRAEPTVFLRAEEASSVGLTCFGVDYLGAALAADEATRQAEREARRAALASVVDPALAPMRDLCLAILGGP